jgi:hypothetical protein
MANKVISLSVPPEVVSDLNYIHRRMGISKSALVTSLLKGGLPSLRQLLESLPAQPDDRDMRRFRGDSASLILSEIQKLQSDVETFGSRS